MAAQSTRRLVLPSGRSSHLWLLALAMLLPGTILAGLGLRGVTQEQRAARDEERDRLDRLADLGVRAVESELRRWQDAAAGLAGASDASREETLRQLAGSASSNGVGPILLADAAGGVRVLPREKVIYALDADRAAAPLPPIPSALAAADDVEVRARDTMGALLAYERLLPVVPAELQPAVLNRLGRTYAAADQVDAALRTYDRLAAMADGRVGPLPASLVGSYERCGLLRRDGGRASGSGGQQSDATACAVQFYDGLVAGRWPIEKTRFEHYIAEARTWLAGSPAAAADLARLQALETRARLVTDEAREALAAWRSSGGGGPSRRVREADGRVSISFSPSPPGEAGGVLLVLPSPFLSGSVWPQTFAALTADDVEIVLVAPGGGVAESTARDGSASRMAATAGGSAESSRTLRDGGAVWQVHVRARGTGRRAASLAMRQGVYVGTLVLMISSLAVGAVVMTRTVRREMEVARLKSQFVSAVSHEFRSPLTSIRQLAELLDRGVPSPERSRQYFKVILDESERLSRLVERVLDFSRMEEGRREYTMAPIATAAWLAGVASTATPMLGGKRLETAIPPDLPSLAGDRDALATAVHNLIDNAAKYSPGCDTVWLSARALPEGVAIDVRDRGIGIAPSDRPHLFDRFYRGAELASAVKGTGLGLSLVKHIVDAHRGRVEIDSVQGHGTTVTVELPTS